MQDSQVFSTTNMQLLLVNELPKNETIFYFLCMLLLKHADLEIIPS